MVPIVIDISPVISRLSLYPEEVKSYSRYVLDTLGRRYMELWEKQVNDNLHQTRSAYKSGIKMEYLDEFNIAFILEGKGQSKLGLMIEAGASTFDIKDGFKKSSKVKQKKDGGWYLTIPFRFATAEAIAESSVFANRMPKPVENIARKSTTPLSTADLPVEFQMKGVRKEIRQGSIVIPEYQHKSPIYSGIQKSDKPNHGGYVNFRRVSDVSDDNSWIHKGFEPHNFMGKALEQLSGEFQELVDLAEDQFLKNRE